MPASNRSGAAWVSNSSLPSGDTSSTVSPFQSGLTLSSMSAGPMGVTTCPPSSRPSQPPSSPAATTAATRHARPRRSRANRPGRARPAAARRGLRRDNTTPSCPCPRRTNVSLAMAGRGAGPRPAVAPARAGAHGPSCPRGALWPTPLVRPAGVGETACRGRTHPWPVRGTGGRGPGHHSRRTHPIDGQRGNNRQRVPPEPGLLGLYEGVPLTERGEGYFGFLPDRISIYWREICAVCATPEDVVEQVRITVVHEIAHHFGIDDDRLHELGWG